jgi:hypothetical protein
MRHCDVVHARFQFDCYHYRSRLGSQQGGERRFAVQAWWPTSGSAVASRFSFVDISIDTARGANGILIVAMMSRLGGLGPIVMMYCLPEYRHAESLD